MCMKVLVVGFGSIGERHVRCFLKTGRCAVSVCELNTELRRRAGAEYGIEKSYADLDAAMSDRYDGAVIASPAQTHVPIATRLAEAGIHLLIEKPLSVSLDGLDRLRAVVDENRLVAMVGYTLRSNPALESMREQLCAGRFGRPLQIIGSVGQTFAHYRPAYADTYFADRATGGGAIQDAITHLVNAGEWLVGPVTRVMADAMHRALHGVQVEDTVHAIVRHGENPGVPGLYGLNLYQAPDEFGIKVVAERGTCQLDLYRQRWSYMLEPAGQWTHNPFPVQDRDEVYIRQANLFLDAVAGTGTPPCTLQEAEQTLRVNLAMLRCVDHPAWTPVPAGGARQSAAVGAAPDPQRRPSSATTGDAL
jgi:predicted dehydrogenase